MMKPPRKPKIVLGPKKAVLPAQSEQFAIKDTDRRGVSVRRDLMVENGVPMHNSLEIRIDRRDLKLTKLIDAMRVRVAYACIVEYFQKEHDRTVDEMWSDVQEILDELGIEDERQRVTMPEVPERK